MVNQEGFESQEASPIVRESNVDGYHEEVYGDLADLSEPDYGYLSEEAQQLQENTASDVFNHDEHGDENFDYDYDYGLSQEEGSESDRAAYGASANENKANNIFLQKSDGCAEKNECHLDADIGGEYILGTLMVRVLQAKNVKCNHHQTGPGGISSLLSSHRRTRHLQQQRHHHYNMSPASAGGNLTPSQYNLQLYSKIHFRGQNQCTSNSAPPSMNGDYYWSRGDQSYFDVVCPAYHYSAPHKTNISHPAAKGKQIPMPASSIPSISVDKDWVCTSMTNTQKQTQQYKPESNQFSLPPVLHLVLYSKRGGVGGNAIVTKKNSTKQSSHFDNNNEEDSEQCVIGKCSINALQILTGKTPYFDEWCTLHNDDHSGYQNMDNNCVGRIRVVIEYEPTDPPPRPGDVCIFASVYSPLMEKELYPIPPFSVRTTMKSSRRASHTVESSCNGTGSLLVEVARQPKQFCVEETVGDHVVLSYQTPFEQWKVTFELHRYNVLCIHRHYGVVEIYKEHVLDFCDNISQSPMAEVLVKTVETLPEEGIIYLGAEAVGCGAAVLGRWFEVGLSGALEDVVDAANLDGRYSHLSDEEKEAEDDEDNGVSVSDINQPIGPLQTTTRDSVSSIGLNEVQVEKEPLPGMPCCPITGQPMIDPVVAADGHTYERYAIARWLQTSNRSPLTGAILDHPNLVPNYLLLSSMSNS